MKLETRIAIAFATLVTVPVLLSVMVVVGFWMHQIDIIEDTYGLENISYVDVLNPIEMLSSLTTSTYDELVEVVQENGDQLKDAELADSINRELQDMNSYLLVREEGIVTYIGDEDNYAIIKEIGLPEYNYENPISDVGTYLGGEGQVLIKQLSFTYQDGSKGTVFIVTDVSHSIPELQEYVILVSISIISILFLTGFVLVFWIQRGVLNPVESMRISTQQIMEGNLDIEVKAITNDELGQLCKDFDEMRRRLKANEMEKLTLDEEKKVLISNITHDLKTPITAIKGYAEGILDGVADTEDKRDRYLRTIYNKANEMNILINELTVYSKVDREKMPYNFRVLDVNDYFTDCAEDLELELEAKNIEFTYFNYVLDDVRIIGDAEQISRVIHNIVNNSVKYMDKERQSISLRVKDTGEFVQVELEDNGQGIRMQDIGFIFDRFYRTDVSRNSATGGSGIGLSIVKKIVEEHGGKVWATSREHVGTVIYFIIRKEQGQGNE